MELDTLEFLDNDEVYERVTRITKENYLDWEDAIMGVAKTAANRFPEVDWEDVSQELWVWALTQDKFDSPDDDGCMTALYWLGKKLAGKERANNLTLSAQYGYTTDELKGVLQDVFSRRDWADAISEVFTDNSLLERVAVFSDVAWALDQLSYDYRRAIYLRYFSGVTHDSGSKERKTLNRAVGRLADILNSYSREGVAAGPTVRRVISNGAAQSLVDRDW